MPQSYGRIEGVSNGDLKRILPYGQRILVKPSETPDYKGSIILPDSVKTIAPTTGTVVTLGFDLLDDNGDSAIPIQENDLIIYSKYAGIEFKYDDGIRILLIHVEDVLGVIQGGTLNVTPGKAD